MYKVGEKAAPEELSTNERSKHGVLNDLIFYKHGTQIHGVAIGGYVNMI